MFAFVTILIKWIDSGTMLLLIPIQGCYTTYVQTDGIYQWVKKKARNICKGKKRCK